MKHVVCLLAILMFVQISFSQEKLEATLIDEFSDIQCDDFLARTDSIINALQNDPTSHGYMVIYGKDTDLRKKLRYQLWFNGALKFRRFDPNRVTVIRGAETPEVRIELWKVPQNAQKPSFNEANWNFALPSSTKSFNFYSEMDDQICSSVSFEKAFAEYISANANSHGNIVIRENSIKNYKKKKREIQSLLYETPRNRLRFFYIKSDSPDAEFWIVPKRN